MQLSEILKGNYTDEEYLAYQRTLHRDRCEKKLAGVTKHKSDASYVEKCIRAAENAMNNMFILPGTRGKLFDVGTPPAWNECRTDDEEYLWSLNRMNYYRQLSDLYHLTDDEKYAMKVLSDTENWIDTCPLGPLPSEKTTPDEMNKIRIFFSGLTPWRSLEVGIRMFDSWNYAYDSLLFSNLMTPELHTKIVCSFYEHALVLREMSPRYWPDANHNHYIHEMLGLLQIACLFPDFDMADSWREFAVYELGRCAKAQFAEDGGQVEGSPGYHYGCLGMFFSLVELAREFNVTLTDNILTTCKRATDYVLASTCPDGVVTPIGDSACNTYGPDFVRRYYKCFGELGPVAKLFAIHPKNSTEIIPEEVQAAARELALNAPSEDNYQRQIDQYFARSGWTPDASHFSFICHSPVYNGHAHIDPMSVTLHLGGDPVLVDPSYYTYRECEERKLFKSPEYHCCLTIDNKPPFEYVARWSYRKQKEGRIRNSYRLPGVYAADASHHGYDPDYHKRLCALVDDDVFLVADEVANVTGSDVRIYFHMDDPSVKVDKNVAYSDRIRVLLPDATCAETVPSERSTRTDLTVPSSRLIITDTSHKSRQYLTVFTKRDDVGSPKIERVDDGIRISFLKGGEEVKLLWTFTESLKRI